jgi:hypothetical protein
LQQFVTETNKECAMKIKMITRELGHGGLTIEVKRIRITDAGRRAMGGIR